MGTLNGIAVDDVAWIRLETPDAVGELRRRTARLAAELGFDEHRIASMSVAVSELATNAVVHGERSIAAVRRRLRHDDPAVEVLVVDSGPGVADLGVVLADGVSTAGTLGIGLGAIDRLTDRFEMYSVPDRGTVTVVAFRRSATRDPMPVLDGLTRPITGEAVCGDAWAAHGDCDVISVVVADGLGHGALAASASNAVIEEFRADPMRGPATILQQAHRQASGTRGAAVMVLSVDRVAGRLRYAGVGNIAARVCGAEASASMLSQPGIVGQQMRNVREVEIAVRSGDLVVVHSDGLTSKWDLSAQRGLVVQSPDVIAAVLIRDAGVRNDDACVVALRVP